MKNFIEYIKAVNEIYSIPFRTFHFSISGGISSSMYSDLLRWCPTLSAKVPIASYNISKFLCWYL